MTKQLTYKQCKKLKDVGFPQPELFKARRGSVMCEDLDRLGENGIEWYYRPDLEELIDACGEEFGYLVPTRDVETSEINGWVAKWFKGSAVEYQYDGKSRIEAAYKLYCAIKNK